jgi:MFS family permease
MFWIQALLNVKVINVISTLFYLHRGLTLSQIFYTAIVWSIMNLLFEIPSSYLADRWGRKKTIILGVMCALISWILMIFAHDFWMFILSFAFIALQFACFSGTDEAIVYDTTRELGEDKNSLRHLGKYYSARESFKILTPFVAVLIAKDLTENQFMILLGIDFFAGLAALILSLKLAEPRHYIDVEKQEAGVIKDAWKLIRSNWEIVRAILSKTIIFIAGFIIWRFHQKFFLDIGVSVMTIGIAWAIIHLFLFLYNQNIKYFLGRRDVSVQINFLNKFIAFIAAVFVLGLIFIENKYFFLVIFSLIMFLEVARWPLYSEFFNKRSKSFNRATTLSLANFLKSILDIPLLFIASILISKNITYPFILALILSLIVIVFFRLPKKYGRIVNCT